MLVKFVLGTFKKMFQALKYNLVKREFKLVLFRSETNTIPILINLHILLPNVVCFI